MAYHVLYTCSDWINHFFLTALTHSLGTVHCYATCIKLDQQASPLIFDIKSFSNNVGFTT